MSDQNFLIFLTDKTALISNHTKKPTNVAIGYIVVTEMERFLLNKHMDWNNSFRINKMSYTNVKIKVDEWILE